MYSLTSHILNNFTVVLNYEKFGVILKGSSFGRKTDIGHKILYCIFVSVYNLNIVVK